MLWLFPPVSILVNVLRKVEASAGNSGTTVASVIGHQHSAEETAGRASKAADGTAQ